MKKVAAQIVIALGMFAFVEVAAACSCTAPPAPLEALPAFDAVFAGQVLNIDRSAQTEHSVQFSVIRSFRGAASAMLSVKTSSDGAACGYNFDEREEYLVYSYLVDGELWTSICTRNNLLQDATDDLAAFDALDLTQNGSERPSCGGPTSAAMIQAGFFLLGGIGLARARRALGPSRRHKA